MRQYEVRLSEKAQEDLSDIWNFLLDRAGQEVADRFTSSILADCLSLEIAPARGVLKLPANVRTIGAAKGRATLIFSIREDTVEILRIHRAGRDHQHS